MQNNGYLHIFQSVVNLVYVGNGEQFFFLKLLVTLITKMTTDWHTKASTQGNKAH